MSHVLYTREEIKELLPLFLDFYDHHCTPTELSQLKEKINSFYIVLDKYENTEYSVLDLNKELWKILGSGLETYLLVIVPFENIPLLINTYKGTMYHEFVKIRLKIGK
jgi:hypothetical protein